MRILVCGSSKDFDPAHHDIARMVGSTIIGNTSHTLLFGGFRAKTPALSVDQVIAEGARSALQRRGQRAEERVVTVVPENDEWDRFYLGTPKTIRGADAAMRRRVMVGNADLIVAIGGTIGTAHILEDAYRLQKPFLPLAFTGGASHDAWVEHERMIIDLLGLTSDEIEFVQSGAEPRDDHLLRIIRRVSGSTKLRLRLLIVSPGDVPDERDAVAEAVREINDGIAHVLALHIEVGRWETDTYPGFHVDGPQGLVDELLRIEDSDIVVGIFGARFGTPTRHAGSGTEHEIRSALAAWNVKRRPHVMLYFRSIDFQPQNATEETQWMRLVAFREELSPLGLLGSYTQTSELERRLRRDLTTFLRTRFFS